MADIYIIYAREDQSTARELYGLLSDRWDVWWDEHIVGDFAEVIEAEIPRAACVIPLYSQHFRNKSTCTSELKRADKHKRIILPVRLDSSDPPYPFDNYSHIDMFSWSGETDAPGFILLLKKISRIVEPKSPPARHQSIFAGNVPLPALFFSVSSHETQLNPAEAVRALRVFGAHTILVSAYDLVGTRKPESLIQEIKLFRERGGFVLVDSGNYEASRRKNSKWKPLNLRESLSHTPHDCAFCFDVMNPSSDPDLAVKQVVDAVKRDSEFTSAPVLPIMHVPKRNDKEKGYNFDVIPKMVRKLSEELNPPLIAIPERELGDGLIARAKTVMAIRKELFNLPYYQPIHLLGTGNPLSIALLAAAGADTFDGLEWCRVVIDPDREKIHHFQHFDFYSASGAPSDFVQLVSSDPNIKFAGKVAFHNLDYFTGFIQIMRTMFLEKRVEAFVTGVLDKDEIKVLKDKFPEILK